MADGTYNSAYKGSEIDSAISVVLTAQVTALELGVLNQVVAGTVAASKSVVVNQQRNITGFNELEATLLKTGLLNVTDRVTDPTENPPTGYAYLYVKSNELYIKNNAGTVTRIASGKKLEFPFSSALSVTCIHNYGQLYPMVSIIGSNNKPLKGQVFFQDATRLIVSFNSVQSGTVIVRVI